MKKIGEVGYDMGCFEDLMDFREAVDRLEQERQGRRVGEEQEGIAVEREEAS